MPLPSSNFDSGTIMCLARLVIDLSHFKQFSTKSIYGQTDSQLEFYSFRHPGHLYMYTIYNSISIAACCKNLKSKFILQRSVYLWRLVYIKWQKRESRYVWYIQRRNRGRRWTHAEEREELHRKHFTVWKLPGFFSDLQVANTIAVMTQWWCGKNFSHPSPEKT